MTDPGGANQFRRGLGQERVVDGKNWLSGMGRAVVADGKVFVGTNNAAGYLDRFPPSIDLGVLLCFDAGDGRFLWQASHQKLATGLINDWPLQGVTSSPTVDGQRLWYVSNRAEVVCLDTEGFL